jgi:hypothetical protein
MLDRHELSIARTVLYASLFDYPLTLEQIHESLIGDALDRNEIAAICRASAPLRAIVEQRDGFFFPAGRADLVAERRAREDRSRAFVARHARALRLICALPFTRMVALSGSVAHLNLEDGGDLDLFIVTRGRRVWTVSVAMIVLTRLLGVRQVMCANFVMADTHLAIEQHDLFTANQILHLKPLFGAEVLEGFVAANPFVRRFYPNRRTPAPSPFTVNTDGWLGRTKNILERMLASPSPAIEAACRRLYAWHLRRRSAGWRSPDQVRMQDDTLKLHTQSHRRSVLERFDERVEEALSRSERAAIA